MNEFKYRAWDNINKIMIEWETIQKQRIIHDLIDDNDITLMQYTGIIDSKNHDIYDKDIVNVTLIDSNGEIYENKTGIVRFCDFEWEIELDDGYWPVASWSMVQSVTILTNVYELYMLMTPDSPYTD